MRWFEKKRIEWIKNRLEPFNRKDLMNEFSISVPQASKDINKFILIYPNKIKYNRKLKKYEINQ